MADVAKAFKGLSENVRQMVESRDVLRNGDFLRNRGEDDPLGQASASADVALVPDGEGPQAVPQAS